MTYGRRPSGQGPVDGLHIATIAHAGHLWDTYLDFENDPHRPTSFRASLRFEPPPGDDTLSTVSTTVIIIEDSYEEAVDRARLFDDRQLQGLLRSALPDPEEEPQA
jgi:hypothetical protein